MRASPIQYELEGLGLSHEQIKKIMTRLPTSSIPLFIESWKREKHEKEASRRSYNVTVPEEYCPRIIPEIAPQRSTEKMESEYQKHTQQRNGINENMNLMAIRFFGEPPQNGYTKDYLHKKYRDLSFVLHPDKNKGDPIPFQMLKTSYDYLLNSIPDSHAALNTNIHSENVNIIHNAAPPPKNMFGGNKSFDIDSFNSYYDNNSLKDPNQEGGYGDWLKKKQDVPKQPNQVSKSNFNDVFESSREEYYESNPNAMALMKTEGPPEDIQKHTACASLGVGKLDDYSGKTDSFQFADLRKAHETPHLTSKRVSHNANENIKQEYDIAVNQNRAMPTDLTKQEMMALEHQRRNKKEEDENRLYRLRQFDEDITNHFQRVNRHQLEL